MPEPTSPSFTFKHFQLWHDHCAMKVSTDGVALGSWAKLVAPLTSESQTVQEVSVLDIGTGTGLLSLMLAQRYAHGADSPSDNKTRICAIEIDPDAAKQAQINVQRSPWADHISITVQDAVTWSNQHEEQRFDHIICNPPYFSQSLKGTNRQRNQARHNDALPFESLCLIFKRHVQPHGHIDVVLPIEEYQRFLIIAEQYGLQLTAGASLQHNEKQPPKRMLFRLQLTPIDSDAVPETDLNEACATDGNNSLATNIQADKRGDSSTPADNSLIKNLTAVPPIQEGIEKLVVRQADGSFHPSFARYTRDFYLKL